MPQPRIIILDELALPLARGIAGQLSGKVFGPVSVGGCDHSFHDVQKAISGGFDLGEPIVGIMAAGILIRTLGPHLRDKKREPPVIAVSHDGGHVVPLLGGHHGANDLARQIAGHTGGLAAITTASDLLFGHSFDNPAPGLVLSDLCDMKAATKARMRGETVASEITLEPRKGSATHLIYHPTNLAVGLGCERGCNPAELAQLLDETLARNRISRQCIACFATIDLKEDEPAVTQFEAVRYFAAAELERYAEAVPNPSPMVKAETGTASVAEAAALAVFGGRAKLLVTKTKSERATLAISQALEPVPQLHGRRSGVLRIVGMGPGDRGHMTNNVDVALLTAGHWVGYRLYLDLIEEHRLTQTRHDFPLGEEEARCRKAIELAKKGESVALVCSGDPAIFAMAALVYELIDREPCRIGVEVHPGISAFQMASARAGALIGHDFCCISLSDLLTPWETIEKRIAAAAEGDFVVAFYNPRSLKRTDQIVKAFDILRPRRKPDTPVILATSIGRPEEKVQVICFDEFDPADVDMLTLVMVGSAQSRAFKRGDGKTHAYTPRGYAKKMDHP